MTYAGTAPISPLRGEINRSWKRCSGRGLFCRSMLASHKGIDRVPSDAPWRGLEPPAAYHPQRQPFGVVENYPTSTSRTFAVTVTRGTRVISSSTAARPVSCPKRPNHASGISLSVETASW